jgi:V-type H+-transporting ATPase subunit D
MVLDEALKVTNRRVNALEYIMIPKIKGIIDWINSELDEESREDFFRLKKVQDNKKRDKKKKLREQSKFNDEEVKEEADEDILAGLNDEFKEEDSDEDVFV